MTTSATTSRPAEELAATGWLPLVVLLSGTFLVVLDFFIVNVALPSIQEDLRASDSALGWVVAGYGLTYGGLLMAAGPLSERWGRRRTFVIGLLVFVLASALCGLAPCELTLNLARLLQGAGAAMLSPMVLALIGDLYVGSRRVRALSAYATVMGMAAVLGQLVGGVLLQADVAGLGWRTIFLVNVPVGLVVAVIAARSLPGRSTGGRRPLDPVSLLLVVASPGALLFSVLEGPRQGWPAWAWAVLACGVLAGVLLVRRTRVLVARGGHPLVDPGALRSRTVRRGLVGQALFFCGMASYFLVLALYLQEGRGLGPLASGLVFTAVALPYMAGTRSAAALVARVGARAVPGAALLFGAGHLLTFFAVGSVGSAGSVLWLTPGLAVSGLAMGVCLSSLLASVMGGVEPRHAAAVSTSLTTVQQLANALGVALIGLVFFGSDRGVAGAFAESLLWLVAGTVVLAGVAAGLHRAARG